MMSQQSNETAENAKSISDGISKNEGEVDLLQLIRVLWRGKFLIIGVTVIAAVISVFIALRQPNIYRSEALLATDDSSSTGGLAGLAAQYGGLASLAGITLPVNEAGQKAVGLAKLQSRQFLGEFAFRHSILPELIAARDYDSGMGELIFDPEIYDVVTNTWQREVDPPLKPEPSFQEAYEEMMGILAVNEDPLTGFVTVSVTHLSPILASEWVTALVSDLNREMMLEATSEAQQSIDYLSEQLEGTQIVALEQVFYSLIEEQTKTIMLANSRPEYLFKTIDPAVIPERKAGPSRALICVLGTLIGGFVGVMTVLTRRYAFGLGKEA